MARALGPQGIHVAYVNVDGPIDMPLIHQLRPGIAKEDMLDPAEDGLAFTATDMEVGLRAQVPVRCASGGRGG